MTDDKTVQQDEGTERSRHHLSVTGMPHKRTAGEWVFDGTAYGGLGMVGNEIAATSIVQQKEAGNLIGRAYRATESFMQAHVLKGPYLRERFTWTTFALGGGMLMVPLIKLMEDRKGKLVRFADSILHRRTDATSPELKRSHDEMDRTPHQTWASLWKGRAVTVAAAYAVDALFIWPGALTSRWLKGTRFENVSTLDHISHRIANTIGDKIHAGPIGKGWLRNGVSLFSFTTVLTALFYVSSKLFALHQQRRHEQREEIREELREFRAEHPQRADTIKETVEAETAKTADKPRPKVQDIAHEARLADATPSLSTGA